MATGTLMALAFPPFNLGQLAWLALVPLLFALQDCGRAEAFRRGYIAGLVFFGMTIWWTLHVTVPGTVALIAFLALYFGAGAMWFAELLVYSAARPRAQAEGAAAGTAAATADSAIRNLVAAVVASAGWVTLEWLRGKLLFGGFPWNFLGVSQHQAVPLIQFAALTGVYGVSALLCFVNVAFFFTLRRFARQMTRKEPARRLSVEFYLAMALVCVSFLHGMGEIRREEAPARTLRLALVQGNIPQTLKFEPQQKPMILQRYRSLTETVIAGKPDLILWPETATPEPLRYDIESFSLATNLAAAANAPLLTGTIDATPFSSPPEYFNAAILLEPDGALQRIYRKLHLVPFGEYVPLRKILPFMKRLTPIQESFQRGSEFTVFELAGLRFAVVICFEDTVPGLYRRFARRDVHFMVNLTNDAWFKESPAAEMHLANAIFRAVENRRPLVRATNNGITCIVDEFGFVRARLDPFVEGSLNSELPLPATRQTTFYTRHGDVFAGACAALTGLVAIGLAGFRRSPLNSSP